MRPRDPKSALIALAIVAGAAVYGFFGPWGAAFIGAMALTGYAIGRRM